MRSTVISPLTAVAHAPSTRLMNYISANHFCVAYPWSFDDDAGILTSRCDVSTTHQELYTQRDYTLSPDPISY